MASISHGSGCVPVTSTQARTSVHDAITGPMPSAFRPSENSLNQFQRYSTAKGNGGRFVRTVAAAAARPSFFSWRAADAL